MWDQIYDVMSDEMAPLFLGPMPSQEFFLAFFPSSQPSGPSHFQVSMFDALTCSQVQTEALMYKIFVSNCISISKVFCYWSEVLRLILFSHTSRCYTFMIHHALQTRLPLSILFLSHLTAQFTTKLMKMSPKLIPPSAISILNSKAKWRKTPSQLIFWTNNHPFHAHLWAKQPKGSWQLVRSLPIQPCNWTPNTAHMS